nr:hypothetical protein [Tanacetum cinerariifolium]
LVHQGEGSGTPTEPHHTPSPESSALPTIADEPASPVRDVSEGEACPTESGFIADQDRETIAKSSTLPYDSAPRVTSNAADEGSMQQTISELMALCTSLQRQHSELLAKFQAQEVEILRLKERVQILEDREGVAAKQSGDDVPIKGRSINKGEAAVERISNDSEEIARVLTSVDATKVLAGGINVLTGSGSIPTADPPAADISTGSEVAPTASPIVTASLIVTSNSRRKGKEVMVESDTVKKQKLQEQIDAQVARELEEQQEKEDMRMNKQIARDAEVARIHVAEELQGMIDSLDRSNETIAKYLQEYQDFASELPLEKRIELISDLVKYQENYSKVYKFQSQQRRPMTKKQKRDYYMAMIRNNLGWKVKDFKGMTFEEIEAKFAAFWKQVEDFIPMGSKEETERLKRKGLNLEQEHVKKQKTSEEAPDIEKSTEEILEEKMKEMMQLDLVKGYLSIRPTTSEKKMELWVELKRLYEPDPEDQLWAETQNYMHAPTEWKLYNLSGVHHVTAKDKEIFMLVEKDYPLRKGLALVMISYKLQGKIVGNKMHKAFLPLVRKFPLPEGTSHCLKMNATVRRIEMPLSEVCTAIEEKKKKLLVKDRWQLN